MDDKDNGTGIAMVPAQQAVDRRLATAPALPPLEFSEDDRQIIRDTIASGATEQEFRLLMAIASAKRLNPLAGQIHFVKRWDTDKNRYVWACQTAIDGLRSMAEDTGLYDGQDDPEFEYATDDANHEAPLLARVRIYRKAISRPFVGVCRYSEYVQTKKDGKPNHMWEKMQHNQLAKCAEAQAFRKAFPQPLGGIYIPEEMHADVINAEAQVVGPIAGSTQVSTAAPAALADPGAKAPADPKADWLARIAAANTSDVLRGLSSALRAAFPAGHADRGAATAAYKAREAALREPPPGGDFHPDTGEPILAEPGSEG